MRLHSVHEVAGMTGKDPVTGLLRIVGTFHAEHGRLRLRHAPSCERRLNDPEIPLAVSRKLREMAPSLHGHIVVVHGELRANTATANTADAAHLRVSHVEVSRKPWIHDAVVAPLPQDIQFSLLAAPDRQQALDLAFARHTGIDLFKLRALAANRATDTILAHQLAWLERQRQHLFDLCVGDFHHWARQQSALPYGISTGIRREGWCVESQGLVWSVQRMAEGRARQIAALCHSPEMAHGIAIGAVLSDVAGRNLALARWPGKDEANDPRLFFELGRQAYGHFLENNDLVCAEQVASRLVSRLTDWPALGAELAESFGMLGQVFYESRRFALAGEIYRAGVEHARQLAADRWAPARTALAMALAAQDSWPAAAAEAHLAIAGFRQANATSDRAYRKALEIAIASAREAGAYAEAERHCRMLIDLMNSQGQVIDAEAARCYRILGELYRLQGRLREARQTLLTGYRLIQGVAGRDSKEAAEFLRELTHCAMARGRGRLAMAAARRAVRTTADDPAYAIVHIRAMRDIAEIWKLRGYLQDAAMAHERCLTRSRELCGEVHIETAVCYDHYALLAAELERPDDHSRMLLRSLAIKTQLYGDEDIRLATAYTGLGICYQGQGKYDFALEFHEKAAQLRQRHLAAGHPDLTSTQIQVAACLMEMGRLDEAESRLKHSMARLHAIHGHAAIELLDGMSLQSTLCRKRGNPAAEEHSLLATLDLLEKAHGKRAPQTAERYVMLGRSRLRQGKIDAARESLASAFSIYRDLEGGDLPELARVLLAQADLAGSRGSPRGKREESEESDFLARCLLLLNEQTGVYRHDLKDRLLDLMRQRTQAERAEGFLGRLLASHPAVDRDRVRLCYDLHGYYFDQGRFDDCDRVLAEVGGLLARIEPAGGRAFAVLYVKQARLRLGQGRLDDAERYCRQAIELESTERPHEASAALGQAFHCLGDIAMARKDPAVAQRHFQQARSIYEVALGHDDAMLGIVLSSLATTHQQRNQPELAHSHLLRALTIKERQWGKSAPGLVEDLNNLAAMSMTRGEFAAADDLLGRARRILLADVGATHWTTLRQEGLIAGLRERQGCIAEAQRLFDIALAGLANQSGKHEPEYADMLGRYASFCWRQGRHQDACTAQSTAAIVMERACGPQHPAVANILEGMVFLLRASGRKMEAPPLQSRIKAIRAKADGGG